MLISYWMQLSTLDLTRSLQRC